MENLSYLIVLAIGVFGGMWGRDLIEIINKSISDETSKESASRGESDLS